MKIRVTYLLLILTTLVQAQDFTKPFVKENFPPDKFQINYKSFPFQELTIEFVLVKELHSISDSGDCNIYLTVLKDKKIVIEKSLGTTWTGGTFGIPKTQPTSKYFMFSYFGEWNGEMTLINTTGELITFPGYSWAITKDKKYIFTKANFPDSDLPVSKFNVETGKYITKEWNFSLKGEPWNEVQPSDYRNLEITLCE